MLRRSERGPRRPIPRGSDPVDDKVYYGATDMRVLGTHRALKEAVDMARVAGKEGTINEGAIGDIPADEGVARHDGTEPYFRMVEEGEVVLLPPEEDPGSTTFQLAQALVRGDEIAHPVQADLAAEIGDRAHAIDLNQDPDAEAGDDVLDQDEEDTKLLTTGQRWQAGTDYSYAGNLERNKAAADEGPAEKKKRKRSARIGAPAGESATGGSQTEAAKPAGGATAADEAAKKK
jgi:hypothetical protein